jgi:hypothetical protein
MLPNMSFSACSRFVKAGLMFAVALVSGPAFAQKAPPQPARSRNQPFNLSASDASASSAARARAKARAEDCAGALPLFDEAIRITIEPTLRRDRGACHDKLGNPTAALDDYRAYLFARPESSDSKEIEERIQVLEGQLESSRKAEEKDAPSGGVRGSASLSINGDKTEAQAGSGASSGSRSDDGKGAMSYDDYAARVKRRDEADSSSLRTGTGGSFGFYTSLRSFVGTGTNTDSVGYSVGVTPRYAFTPNFSLVGELGFAGFGARARTASGGIAVWVGAEFRVKLDSYASNSLIFGVGPGFERYVGLDRSNSAALNTGHLRGRIGFRHVFGANVGLDVSFDPAVVFASYDGPPTIVNVNGQSFAVAQSVDPRALLGGNLALVVGF